MKDNKKKAIVVLGGGLIKEGSHWKTIDLGEGGDNFAVSNDRWRVEAAAVLWQEEPDYSIIVLGGKGQLTPISDALAVASVIKSELKELGVPEEIIITEERSGNSLEQLLELKSLAIQRNLEEIIIISNEWHLPRIKAIIEFYPGLKESLRFLSLQFISAEEILLEHDPEKWRSKVESARLNLELKKRYELEEKGVEQLKKGTYKFSHYISNNNND